MNLALARVHFFSLKLLRSCISCLLFALSPLSPLFVLLVGVSRVVIDLVSWTNATKLPVYWRRLFTARVTAVPSSIERDFLCCIHAFVIVRYRYNMEYIDR